MKQRLSLIAALVLGTAALSTAEERAKTTEPTTASATNSIPLKQIILYSSGTGFFERAGEVEDRATIEMRFKTDDINDLLKSLVVQDLGGGTVTAVTYDSRDPLTKTLKSFGVD